MFMLNSDYIVGLVDGEGSFTAYVRNLDEKKLVKRRILVEPRFYLKLREDDREVLYQLKKFFNCGNIYFQKDKRKNHKNCYRYEVANRESLEKIIIPFFKHNHLKLFSKRKDFKIFCKIIEKLKKKEHLTKSGLEKIYNLKRKMH